MSAKEFYKDPDLADGFGSTKGRPNPHRGLDFAHPAGTPIPVHAGGTVVTNEWSNVLGWVAEVYDPIADRVDGYRHMQVQSEWEIGSAIDKFEIVGLVGNTGSASKGNHLCTTNGDHRGSVHGVDVSDPWPRIFANVNAPDKISVTVFKKEIKNMLFLKDTQETWWLIGSKRRKVIGDPDKVVLFDRAINRGDTQFNRTEIFWMSDDIFSVN